MSSASTSPRHAGAGAPPQSRHHLPSRQQLALDLPDASLAGIAAFYAVVNLPRESLPQVFRELARVLQPDGMLLFAHHIGEETLHRDEWWDRPISMDFHFLQPLEVQRDLEAAGLRVEEIIERDPYAPAVEHQSGRAYIFARKPAAAELI
jgi:SAM-dependent methyltransferase